MHAPDFPIPDMVYELSEAGRQQLKGGTTALFSDALRFLLLADGKLKFRQIAKRLKDVPEAVLGWTVFELQQKGFVLPAASNDPDLAALDFSHYVPPDPATAKAQSDEEFAARLEEAHRTMDLMSEQGYAVRIAHQARSTAKSSSGGAYSVLIVEDEPSLSSTMRRVLELERFAPRVAANFDQVAAELRKPPVPDLILLDVVLPGGSGFDILDRLRAHPALKQIPVIMVTAMSAREDVLRALTADANGYITKPFTLAVLMKGIKAVLGLH